MPTPSTPVAVKVTEPSSNGPDAMSVLTPGVGPSLHSHPVGSAATPAAFVSTVSLDDTSSPSGFTNVPPPPVTMKTTGTSDTGSGPPSSSRWNVTAVMAGGVDTGAPTSAS